MTEKLKGFDTSRHNHNMTDANPEGDPIDFQAAWDAGYRIWIGRASVGNYYIDPWFQRDFDAAGAVGFIRLAYHVTHPEYSTASQIDKFKEALGGRKPDGIVIDSEVSGGQTMKRCTDCLGEHDDDFTILMNGNPDLVLCYTNQNYSDHYLNNNFGLDLIVANPGPGNGMNTNPIPSMPDLWEDFIAWQKDWKHVVPGVPDNTVDYQEWEITWEDALARFKSDQGTPPPVGCDLTPILTELAILGSDINLINDQLARTDAKVAQILEILQSGGGSTPPSTRTYIVTEPEKTLACYVNGYNGKGFPIIKDQIFENPRLRWDNGMTLEASVNNIQADGSTYWYKLAPGQTAKNSAVVPATPDLFVNADDVSLV